MSLAANLLGSIASDVIEDATERKVCIQEHVVDLNPAITAELGRRSEVQQRLAQRGVRRYHSDDGSLRVRTDLPSLPHAATLLGSPRAKRGKAALRMAVGQSHRRRCSAHVTIDGKRHALRKRDIRVRGPNVYLNMSPQLLRSWGQAKAVSVAACGRTLVFNADAMDRSHAFANAMHTATVAAGRVPQAAPVADD